MIVRLYGIEHEARNNAITFNAMMAIRQEHSPGIIAVTVQWLISLESEFLPKRPIGKNKNYTRNL